VFDGDEGPNTGGMGAYAPAPLVDEGLAERIRQRIMLPVVQAMAKEGRKYKGVIYAGLMVVEGEPYVLEFNVRFGDPETQCILPLLESDLLEVMEAVVDERLAEVGDLQWRAGAAVCVVLASEGYPGSYRKGLEISGVAETERLEDVLVFHAGTRREGERWVTAGGRVLGVVGRGKDLPEAIQRAYAGVECIRFEGMHFRRDIGRRALRFFG